MKTLLKGNQKKLPTVRINPALDQFDNVVLFPEKLAKANAQLAESGGLPQLPLKNTEE